MGESRSPVFSPGSMEPRREAGPAAMGHPPWGSSMGFTLSTSEMGSIGPCPLDRPSTARRGGGPERSPVRWRQPRCRHSCSTRLAPGSDSAADAFAEHGSGETSEHVRWWRACVTRSPAGGRGAESGGEAYVERGATSLATIAEGRHSISRRVINTFFSDILYES